MILSYVDPTAVMNKHGSRLSLAFMLLDERQGPKDLNLPLGLRRPVKTRENSLRSR